MVTRNTKVATLPGPTLLSVPTVAVRLAGGVVAQLGGDFAVGLRDAQGRGFLAVDRFGMRTLCYRIVGGQLRFAAQATELADPGHPLDLQAVYDYLYFHAIPSPRTIYQGIFRLPPGHCATFQNGQLTVAPYWTPTFQPEGGRGFQALKAEFRQLLRDAWGEDYVGETHYVRLYMAQLRRKLEADPARPAGFRARSCGSDAQRRSPGRRHSPADRQL